MIVEPGKAFIMGGTYRIPVLLGLQNKNFIDDLRKDSTFNEAGFSREYESKWTGIVENAFFNGEAFDHNRQLNLPENEASGKISKNGYYILSMDFGRKNDASEICVLKVNPQPDRLPVISLVNIYSLNKVHSEEQVIFAKRLFFKYNARRIIFDCNGPGTAVVDIFVKPQYIPETGEVLPDFGVENDPDRIYKKYQTKDCVFDALYTVKANASFNTEAHVALQTSLNSSRLKFLIHETLARQKLLDTKKGKDMTPEERNEYLRPFVSTTILKDQLMNLREENEGINIILKQANKGIKKDKVSSLEYGVWYINQNETHKKKKKFNVKDFMFIS